MAHGAFTAFKTDVALATTGYAEPWPAEGVTEPHAYFAVMLPKHDARINQGKVIPPKGASRAEVQDAVVEAVLEGLLEALRGLDE